MFGRHRVALGCWVCVHGRVVVCGVALGAWGVDVVMCVGGVCVLSFCCRGALSSVLLPRSRFLRPLIHRLRSICCVVRCVFVIFGFLVRVFCLFFVWFG